MMRSALDAGSISDSCKACFTSPAVEEVDAVEDAIAVNAVIFGVQAGILAWLRRRLGGKILGSSSDSVMILIS